MLSPVNSCVSGEHGAERCPAWGANREADEGGNSARRSTQEASARPGGGANSRPGESAHYKADHGVLATPGARSGRNTGDVFAFYRNVGALLSQGDRFIGDGDKFSAVTLHVGFDHVDSLANLQAA